jgi:hypothetical protein
MAYAAMKIADSTGGVFVDEGEGSKLMMLFATPDAAASAASLIHAVLDRLPAIDGAKLGAHIGFHTGPAPARLARQLLALAQEGRTITTRETAAKLNPAVRRFSSASQVLQADARNIWLYEVASWHRSGLRPEGWSATDVLRLAHGGQLVVCSRDNPAIVIGREAGCDLVLDAKAVSRRHCTIEHVRGRFVVRDHSSNGTYVTASRGAKVLLQNREGVLAERGLICLGEPTSNAPHAVTFRFASMT